MEKSTNTTINRKKSIVGSKEHTSNKQSTHAKPAVKPIRINKLPYPRLLSRAVVGISLFVIIYFMYQKQGTKTITFARQSDVLSGKTKALPCASDYIGELDKYDGCMPKDCRRFISDTVVSQTEAANMLNIFTKFLQYGGSPNGASILDLHSGALSKGEKFINIHETSATKNLLTAEDLNQFRVIKEKIKYTISNFFGVSPDKIYLTSPTFFSKLEFKEPANIHDEYWHPHVDKETYPSYHYTSLLYLSDYKKDFGGGRFMFVDNKLSAVEPKKGRLSIFTSGSENTHFVERVTNGTRFAMTISFTCDKKHSVNM